MLSNPRKVQQKVTARDTSNQNQWGKVRLFLHQSRTSGSESPLPEQILPCGATSCGCYIVFPPARTIPSAAPSPPAPRFPSGEATEVVLGLNFENSAPGESPPSRTLPTATQKTAPVAERRKVKPFVPLRPSEAQRHCGPRRRPEHWAGWGEKERIRRECATFVRSRRVSLSLTRIMSS